MIVEKDRAMNPLLMKALIDGAAVIIGSVVNTAARKGLAILVLLLVVFSLAGCISFLWGKMERMELDFEGKIERNNREWKTALDTARMDWRNCEERREALAVEVAVLRKEVFKLKSKR